MWLDLLMIGGTLIGVSTYVVRTRSDMVGEVLRSFGGLIVDFVRWNVAHLVGAVLVLAALIITTGIVIRANEPDTPPRPLVGNPVHLPTSAVAAPATLPATPSSSPAPSSTPSVVPVPPVLLGLITATTFVQRWAATAHVTRAQWAQRLAPYSTANLASLMGSTDPANVPTVTTIRPAREVYLMDRTLLASVWISTTRGDRTVQTVLVISSGQWKVDSILL